MRCEVASGGFCWRSLTDGGVCLSLVGRHKQGWVEKGAWLPCDVAKWVDGEGACRCPTCLRDMGKVAGGGCPAGGAGGMIDVGGRNLELSLTEVLVQVMNV